MSPLRPIGLLLAALALASLGPAVGGDSLSSVGQLPGEKVPIVLLPKERNPFTRHEVKTEITADKESEESRLRTLLGAMPVTGLIRGGATPKVLLGSLILRPGHPIPSLLEDQTEHLVVGTITLKQVEILFVETEPHAEPRRILIPIDLSPHVTVRLPELPSASAKPPGKSNPPPE